MLKIGLTHIFMQQDEKKITNYEAESNTIWFESGTKNLE